MTPAPSTTRLLHIIALLCILAVTVALLSQHMFDMPPCAWCVFQRLIYIVIAAACWIGLGLQQIRPALGRMAAVLVVVLAVAGIAAAWYQYDVAAQMFSCDLTFADRFMVASGLDSALPWLFGIYATCMDARVDLFGVEYALWSMALFFVLALLAMFAARKN